MTPTSPAHFAMNADHPRPQGYSSLLRRLEEAQGARLRSTPAALEAKSKTLCEHLLAKHPCCPSSSFAFFFPLRDEPNILPVAEAWFRLGARACLPAPRLEGEPLSFWPWDFESPLEGIDDRLSWPMPANPSPPLLPGLILSPCALFDQAGRRAGYGHGLYQRTLRAARVARPGILVIGCTLEWSRAPHGVIPGDPMLDAVATELGLFDTSRPVVTPRRQD